MAKDRATAQQGIANLLPKLDDPDPDIRFMQLSDLANILNAPSSEYLRSDNHGAARIIDRLIKALTDQNGEVQNQALKCVGPLGVRTPHEYIAPYIDKITELTFQDIDISVPITALRTLVVALPHPPSTGNEKDVKEAFSGISRVLVPRLVGRVILSTEKKAPDLSPGLLQQQKDKSYSSDAVDVMIEVIRCYGSLLREEELTALGNATLDIIRSPQASGVVKKRALVGISAVVPFYKSGQLDTLIGTLGQELKNNDLAVVHRRYLVSSVGALARSIPARMGPYLNVLAPLVLDTLGQDQLDSTRLDSDDEAEVEPDTEELREATLVTLEAMLSSCTTEMQPHWQTATDAALRYLKYDPNVVDLEDEEMGGTQDAESDDGFTEDPADDDDEYAELDDDDAFGDVEDLSWKVRRCAAKVLHTIILSSAATDHDVLFEKIVPVLISRLNSEREDSVRLEVIAATTALIRKTGSTALKHEAAEANGFDGNTASNVSHKRKRQDSNVSADDPDLRGLVLSRSSPPFVPAAPPLGPQADLALVVPRIVQATVRLWKKGSIALKQAAVLMLRAIAQTRNGALADHLQQLEDPLADALKSSGGSGSTNATGSTATAASLQIETLSLISTIAETNGSTVLIPFVIALISSVTSLVRDRNTKVSIETLATIEQFVKALTPPRLSSTNQDHAIHIEKLYDVVVGPVNDVNADLEVRHRAIHVFGVLIARTSSTRLISQEARTKGLGVLNDRLKNETTRRESAKAIGLVAEAASLKDNIGSAWVQEVSVEMANQLRKADRILRASCLEALQYLALNQVTAAQYETSTIQELQTQLMPLISAEDLHLLTPALVIMAKIIPTNAEALVDAEVVKSLCLVAQARLEGPPLKAYLLVIKVIGEQGVGAQLMSGLLAVGTAGDTHVLGRAIGTLMHFGGGNVKVSVNDFLKEVQSQSEDAACLALTVLGEVGLREGSASPVDMNIFIQSLSAKSDKVRLSAAIALGSASSSSIPQYLPAILQKLGASDGEDHLYLHALKEILQNSESSASQVAPYSKELWDKLFAVSGTEDNSAIGAECIGRLVFIDPTNYLLSLSTSLDDSEPSVRGTVISAFRFTLGDNSNSYNNVLAKMITPLLTKMLSDSDIGNRRLAITTLTAAVQHKPNLVLPDIALLLPQVVADTHLNKALIKTVKIGPFTHHEDSGLDLRKSAYSTLYTLLETPKALPHLSFVAFFDRIQDGIPDDHDIRTLCNLMLSRLSNLDPEETKRRLPALAEQFRKVLEIKPKENAVKQEIERINEANTAVIRTTMDLAKKFASATQSTDPEMMPWRQYMEYVNKEFASVVKDVAASEV